jgi:N-dimethylarginine dimethylaminohydrolase
MTPPQQSKVTGAKQSSRILTRAIVRPPSRNFSDGLSTAGLGAPSYELALKQHADYCAALEQCGLTLTYLEADFAYPDSTFVEDTAVLTESAAMLTRPGAPSRRGEVQSISQLSVKRKIISSSAFQNGQIKQGPNNWPSGSRRPISRWALSTFNGKAHCST